MPPSGLVQPLLSASLRLPSERPSNQLLAPSVADPFSTVVAGFSRLPAGGASTATDPVSAVSVMIDCSFDWAAHPAAGPSNVVAPVLPEQSDGAGDRQHAVGV